MLFLKKKPARIWWISTILSIAGVILLFSNQGSVQADPVGILLALSAAGIFGLYDSKQRSCCQHEPSAGSSSRIYTEWYSAVSILIYFRYELDIHC